MTEHLSYNASNERPAGRPSPFQKQNGDFFITFHFDPFAFNNVISYQ
jgi:hypothetical protein